MTYIAPQTFREWHPIGIVKSINKQKPFVFNIGSLPMILWFYNSNPNAMINICKHLGNNLDDGFIDNHNKCLVCPFHKNRYNQTDNFGSIVEKDGLYWWSYKSYHKNPPLPSKSHNTHNYQLDINTDLLTFVLNFISISDSNNDNHRYYHNKNKKQIFIRNNDNRIIYNYPYSIIMDNYRLSILPLSYSKLRIFVTTYNPIIKILSYMYMFYIKYLFEYKIGKNDLKHLFLFKKGMNGNNGYLEDIYKSYKDYMFLTKTVTNQFLINRNFY